MPLVRIDLLEGKTPEYRAQIGQIVYWAMLDVLNVPKDDRFQIIIEHPQTGLQFTAIISASIDRTIAFSCKSP